jgi:hypothetical protein
MQRIGWRQVGGYGRQKWQKAQTDVQGYTQHLPANQEPKYQGRLGLLILKCYTVKPYRLWRALSTKTAAWCITVCPCYQSRTASSTHPQVGAVGDSGLGTSTPSSCCNGALLWVCMVGTCCLLLLVVAHAMHPDACGAH